ncbi:unnamed protein product, partial [Mesorhabditis spiculigera]
MGGASKTKHGKQYRAPVDQARKQERMRVIKKNKKERQQVRVAIAKHTEVASNLRKSLNLERQILGLDERQFAIEVLKKKQKAIMDAIDKRRTVLTNSKDEMEIAKLNEAMKTYHAQVASIKRLAEQEKMARSVDPNAIPLPDGDLKEGADRQLQLMGPRVYEQSSRREERSVRFKLPRDRKKPPGPPCGPAPDLSASEDEMVNDDFDVEDTDLGPVPIPEELGHAPGFGIPLPNFSAHPLLRPTIPKMVAPPLFQPPQIVAGPPSTLPDHATISSAPQIRSRMQSGIGPVQPTTLVGAPQLRDLRQEAAKFVPAVLKKKPHMATNHLPIQVQQKAFKPAKPAKQPVSKSTDDAYNEFMREMEGLL